MNNNQKYLITGGSGSVGKALIQMLIEDYGVSVIRSISHSENNQWRAIQHFKRKGIDDKIEFRLADICDYDSIELAMKSIDIVVHLAALKHIDLCSKNPLEALHVNVLGSCNVFVAAKKMGVKKVLGISTDKACNGALNLYGHSKSCMEYLFVDGNRNMKSLGDTIFSCVRTGNILGSSGSVSEIFRQQCADDVPLTITDPQMTRFWTNLPAVAGFIIESLEVMQGGEIFISKIGSCPIGVLADHFSTSQKIIGKKPGEKVHEILMSKEESVNRVEFKSKYILSNEVYEANAYEYRSDTNKKQLQAKDIKRMLKENDRYTNNI